METPPVPVELWLDPDVLRIYAERHYRDLPFHNWQHALSVEDIALQKAELCLENGVAVDVAVIRAASLYHDAGFWLRPGVDHNFRSKEEYSAFIAGEELRKLGMPENKIAHVQSAIHSTERGVACESVEARCVRQADLANVASRSPVSFLRKTVQLYLESKQLADKSLSAVGFDEFVRFCNVSYDILSSYLAEDVSLGAFDREPDSTSFFCKVASRNINFLHHPETLQKIWSRFF